MVELKIIPIFPENKNKPRGKGSGGSALPATGLCVCMRVFGMGPGTTHCWQNS